MLFQQKACVFFLFFVGMWAFLSASPFLFSGIEERHGFFGQFQLL